MTVRDSARPGHSSADAEAHSALALRVGADAAAAEAERTALRLPWVGPTLVLRGSSALKLHWAAGACAGKSAQVKTGSGGGAGESTSTRGCALDSMFSVRLSLPDCGSYVQDEPPPLPAAAIVAPAAAAAAADSAAVAARSHDRQDTGFSARQQAPGLSTGHSAKKIPGLTSGVPPGHPGHPTGRSPGRSITAGSGRVAATPAAGGSEPLAPLEVLRRGAHFEVSAEQRSGNK
ncbi:hypothetical protein T492DRAFT_848234 [Pavlovales sp. CCMP2436]|nr:hypothetical protein T492DRAFT_848234 [Pavlovales sp. CCMP2436]